MQWKLNAVQKEQFVQFRVRTNETELIVIFFYFRLFIFVGINVWKLHQYATARYSTFFRYVLQNMVKLTVT